MEKEDLELLARLVEINTDVERKGGYSEFVSFMREEAEKDGFKVREYDSIKASNDGISRPSLIIGSDFGSEKTLIISIHYDTVPAGEGWRYNPYRLTVVGEKAYGRGACDDKGDIIAAYSAIKAVEKKSFSKYNLILALTPEEEVGGDLGLGYVVEKGYLKGDFALVLDSSPSSVSVGACGIVWGKVSFKGVQGHAAYPHRAENPIHNSLPVLNDFRRYSRVRERVRSILPAQKGSLHRRIWGRFSITMLHSGIKENVIPGDCEARFDMRVNPDEEIDVAKGGLREYFEAIKKKRKVEGEIEFIKDWPPYYTSPEHPFVKDYLAAASSVAGVELEIIGELASNDGHFFPRVGIPVICHGVLREDCRFHGVDEFVYIKDIDYIKNTIVKFCS